MEKTLDSFNCCYCFFCLFILIEAKGPLERLNHYKRKRSAFVIPTYIRRTAPSVSFLVVAAIQVIRRGATDARCAPGAKRARKRCAKTLRGRTWEEGLPFLREVCRRSNEAALMCLRRGHFDTHRG